MRAVIAVVVLLMAGAVAWWFTREDSAVLGPGMMAVEWDGSARGRALLPGEVHWCPVNRTARLEAISNDTGVVLLLYERDSLSVAPHQVLGPEFGAGGTPRPGATAAIRWVHDTLMVMGFRAVSGIVDVAAVSPAASGSFNIRMQHPTRPDTLTVRGNFRDIPVTIAAIGCP